MSSATVFRLLIAICAVLLLVDIVNLGVHLFEHKGKFQAEAIPNFYGFFALIAALLVAAVSAWCRKVLMRDEDYYDDDVD